MTARARKPASKAASKRKAAALDPATLRWAADEMERWAEERGPVLGSISYGPERYREWSWIRALRMTAKRFRALATRHARALLAAGKGG